MIEKNKGNILNPEKYTDLNGFTEFAKVSEKEVPLPTMLIEGSFPSGIYFEVYFKAQVTNSATPFYSDYVAGEVLKIDKVGKINLDRIPNGATIGLKALDNSGTIQAKKSYPGLYIGVF